MDIFEDVVNRKTIPTTADPDGRFKYHAERLTAMAITQTYNYMIEGVLEYGLLTTGETIDEQQRVIFGLRRWAEDFETTLRSIPRDERYAPSGSSSGSLYTPTTYAGISRSPRVPRTRSKRWAPAEDRPDVQLAKPVAADHLIDRDEFLRLLFQQLQESLDHGISRLDMGGSRNVLFKISLMAYGYTFVTKGTVSAFIQDLGHETTIYKHLEGL
ncbi:hypothetical protein BKA67DRAFT_663150 [Truncatella angustata]|uniref:Uncharacterized protein n=1 Tax=Truncatella angustata TaxID=152316 RepID=A0A9P8RP53_9PEZI|nr:uncharacterized protein BKA67DRAFT_663150 [Truncatella angustata]KAH6646751.1 hypothetical protein BKA67DRAFT_663150 [Truncatella angustata]